MEAFDPIMELSSNKYLTTAYSGDVSEAKIKEMISFVEKYNINITPANVFRLEEVSEVHRQMESKHNIGKNIVILD